MGNIVIKALALVLVIGIGFAIKRMGWVQSDDFPKFSKIVLRLTLPCLLITNFNQFDIPYNLLFLMLAGFLANIIPQWTGFLVARRHGRPAQAFAILNISSYNIGAFAIPYITGFAGAQSVIYASIFDMGNSVAAAGIGYGWAMSLGRANQRVTVWRFFRNMFSSPIFDTYLFMMILRFLDWRLPDPIIVFTTLVGGANTFLAMLMIGIGLELRLDPEKYRRAFGFLGLRYAFTLVFAGITYFLLPFDPAVKTVVCMLLFSPIAAMITGFTSEINGEVDVSAFMTSVSVLIGIVAIPLVYGLTGLT